LIGSLSSALKLARALPVPSESLAGSNARCCLRLAGPPGRRPPGGSRHCSLHLQAPLPVWATTVAASLSPSLSLSLSGPAGSESDPVSPTRSRADSESRPTESGSQASLTATSSRPLRLQRGKQPEPAIIWGQGTEPPMGTGDGDDPRSPANRGWRWGWTPADSRQIGDGTAIPDPRQIGDGGGDGDRGFRAQILGMIPC
jgi:hypothetical protein